MSEYAITYVDDLIDCITAKIAHWWSYDEVSGNRADSEGSVTLTDASTVPSSASIFRFGRSAGAFSSDYFTASLAGSPIDNQGSFWGAQWIRITTRPSVAGRPYCIWKKGDHDASDYTGESWVFGIQQATNYPYLRVTGDVLSETIARPLNLATNTWYFIYFYYDADTGEIGISVNNGTVSKNTFGGTDLMHDLDEFDVGRYSSADTQYFTGYMDEGCMGPGKLDADEVTFLYCLGAGTRYDDLFWDCEGGDQILWAGAEFEAEVVDTGTVASNIYFYDGSNGIPTYLAEPYDSTCGYYTGSYSTVGFQRVISDRYPSANNNVPFGTGQFIVKFDVVAVLSGSGDVQLNYASGREGEWWDLFRTDIRVTATAIGTESVRVNVTVAVDDGNGDSSVGAGIPVTGTEVTRSVVITATRTA